MTTGSNRPIGVFDSGVGGLSILKALRVQLPAEDFVYLADTGHAPYGERGDDYVIGRTRAIVQQLREQHAIKALVIACNTATAAAIHLLRGEHAELPMVGVEPALKPARAMSRTRRIGVMATRGTLASAKFNALLEGLQGTAEFVLQPCDGLAAAIESHDAPEVERLCRDYVRAMGRFGSAPGEIDTLVLGCTHYAFARHVLEPLLGGAVGLVETGGPVARQAARRLKEGGLLATQPAGRVVLRSTGAHEALQTAAARWL